MICEFCDIDPCMCKKPAPVRDTTAPAPRQPITKEQFGLELYEAIACCSGVQQLLRMIAAGVNSNKDVEHLSERYKIEKEKAKGLAQSEAISTEDAVRLVHHYPWLLA